MEWQKRKILIWGKTRPELSSSYREVVCTGGVFEDTKKLVRLYPIPLRFIDDEKIFKKYQWIEAKVKKAKGDNRPESFKILPESIKVDGILETKRGDWSERAVWILNDKNIFQSVEALQEKQSKDFTSLGLVKPLEILDVQSKPVSISEKHDFGRRYEQAIQQMDLQIDPDANRERKPLRPSDYNFTITFRCDDERCKTRHTFTIRDWEPDALYFKQLNQGLTEKESSQKVIQRLQDICSNKNDLYFFLGNISNYPHTFTIVGLWYPKKTSKTGQQKLFTQI